MPKDNQNPPAVPSATEELQATPPAQRRADLQVIMQQVAGLGQMPDLTEAQISEVLAQRRLVTDYTRADRKDNHEQFKDNTQTLRLFWITGLAALLIVFISVLLFKPDLLSQLVSALLGGGGGYGIGRATGNKN